MIRSWFSLCVCIHVCRRVHMCGCAYTRGHVCGGRRSASATVNILFWNSLLLTQNRKARLLSSEALYLPSTTSLLSFLMWVLEITLSLGLQNNLYRLSLLPSPRCTLLIHFWGHIDVPASMVSSPSVCWRMNLTNLPGLLCFLHRQYETEFGNFLFKSIFTSYDGHIKVYICLSLQLEFAHMHAPVITSHCRKGTPPSELPCALLLKCEICPQTLKGANAVLAGGTTHPADL